MTRPRLPLCEFGRQVLHHGTMQYTLPIRLQSEQNRRDHWRVVAKRKQEQHALTRNLLRRDCTVWAVPATVTFRRIAWARFDSDAVPAACKYVRDAIAALFGIDDADPRIEWRYEPCEISRKRAGLVVRIESRPA